MCWVINHCFDGGGLVVKLLGGDASVIFVEVLEDGWDERCDFSRDGVSKGGNIFGVDGFYDLLDECSLKKKSLYIIFFVK